MPDPNLIIDVGMHDGRDTAYYLAKGFDVVAVEANPELVKQARDHFAEALASGQLRIVPAAVAESEGTTQLAVSDVSIWSSLSPEFTERNAQQGVGHRLLEVPTVRFEQVLQDVGTPRYLKVDIEGYDMLCVRALREFDDRPDFVSIESNVTSNQAPVELIRDEIREFVELGYRRFAYVNQGRLPEIRLPDPPREGAYVDTRFTTNHSGPFGREMPGRWESPSRTLARGRVLALQHNFGGIGGRWSATIAGRGYRAARAAYAGVRRRQRGAPWYDLHAAR